MYKPPPVVSIPCIFLSASHHLQFHLTLCLPLDLPPHALCYPVAGLSSRLTFLAVPSLMHTIFKGHTEKYTHSHCSFPSDYVEILLNCHCSHKNILEKYYVYQERLLEKSWNWRWKCLKMWTLVGRLSMWWSVCVTPDKLRRGWESAVMSLPLPLSCWW